MSTASKMTFSNDDSDERSVNDEVQPSVKYFSPNRVSPSERTKSNDPSKGRYVNKYKLLEENNEDDDDEDTTTPPDNQTTEYDTIISKIARDKEAKKDLPMASLSKNFILQDEDHINVDTSSQKEVQVSNEKKKPDPPSDNTTPHGDSPNTHNKGEFDYIETSSWVNKSNTDKKEKHDDD